MGMPVRLATDPEFQGRGDLPRARVGKRGARARPRDPAAPDRPQRGVDPDPRRRAGLDEALARPALVAAAPRTRPPTAVPVDRFDDSLAESDGRRRPRRFVTATWLNWRFADSPKPYALLAGGGYAVVGSHGRVGMLAAVEGDLLGDAAAVAEGRALVAAPPPWLRRRYLRAGYLPTHRTFTVLGKSLDPALPLPAAPAFRARRPRFPVRRFPEADRLRDPGGRSRRPDPRRGRREDARARRAGRRGRRPCPSGRPRRPAGELPRPSLRRLVEGRPRAAPMPLPSVASSPRSRSRSWPTASRSTRSWPPRSRSRARVPLLLWFTHWKPSRTLVLAERLSTAILSVDRRSFPLDSGKVVAIGHGIDTDRFACTEREPGHFAPSRSGGRHRRRAWRPSRAAPGLPASSSTSTARRRPTRSAPSGSGCSALGVRLHEPVPYGDVPALLASGRCS